MLKKVFAILLGLIAQYACNTKSKVSNEAFAADIDVAKACKIVYHSQMDSVQKQILPNYEIILLPQSQKGNLGILLKNKNREQYILAIRGTLLRFEGDGLVNIIQDANIINQKKWQTSNDSLHAFVSEGAFEGFNNIKNLQDSTKKQMLDIVLKSLPKHASLVIAGHSLGGNIANLVASHYKPNLNCQVQLITFGAPASGNQDFVTDLENKFPLGKRYIIENDVAALFPDINKFRKGAAAIGINDSIIKAQIAMETNGQNMLLLGLSELVLNVLDNVKFNSPYVQSEKQLKALHIEAPIQNAANVFDKAYYYHNINGYIKAVAL